MKLTDFKALTFDCYGTLIDWETGLYAALQPLLKRGGVTLQREEVLATFGRHEMAQEATTPQMLYSELLAEVHRRLAREWHVSDDENEALAFGQSVPDWPAFPDTAGALHYLQRYYKLIILSNVDRDSFAGSSRKLGVAFDAICTAQDIGSYKPDPRNFAYLINSVAELGVLKRHILHTHRVCFTTMPLRRQRGSAAPGSTAGINSKAGAPRCRPWGRRSTIFGSQASRKW